MWGYGTSIHSDGKFSDLFSSPLILRFFRDGKGWENTLIPWRNDNREIPSWLDREMMGMSQTKNDHSIQHYQPRNGEEKREHKQPNLQRGHLMGRVVRIQNEKWLVMIHETGYILVSCTKWHDKSWWILMDSAEIMQNNHSEALAQQSWEWSVWDEIRSVSFQKKKDQESGSTWEM